MGFPDGFLRILEKKVRHIFRVAHLKDLFIRQKRKSLLIHGRKLGTDHQRGTEKAPQRQHGLLLFESKVRAADLSESLPQHADRKHITVRKAPCGNVILPDPAAVEHVPEKIPAVPEIVCNAPHIRIFLVVGRFFNESRSGGKRQHNGPPGLFDGPVQHLYFVPCRIGIVGIHIRVTDIVAFNEVHTPGGVKRQQGVIVELAGFGVFHAVHIRVPFTDGRRIGDLVGRNICSQNGAVKMGRQPRDAPHDVNTEFQAFTVDIISQFFET